jgi:hypothetical protein
MVRLPRKVVYDFTFEEQAKLLEPDAVRLDDAIRGAEWAISNHPEKLPIIEKNLRVAFTDNFPDMPAMRIFFSITDEHTCTVHWIERLEQEDEFLGM